MKRPAALVVVRDPTARALAVQLLEERGFEVAATESADDREQLLSLARRVVADEGRSVSPGTDGAQVLGQSEAMQQVRAQIAAAARATDAVWIVGESGSGRRAVAERIHATSPRAEAPFTAIDCADAREVEAFLRGEDPLPPGASGSLYFASLGELRLDRQLDLLHKLESGLGAGAGVRVLFGLATDPARAVQDGRLLDDLRQRFAGITVPLPPLRERRGDVSLLAWSFLHEICEMNHLPPIRISSSAVSLLEGYAWPGNVEELRLAIEQAAIVSQDEIIRPNDLPEAVRESGPKDRPRIPAGVSARAFREAKREVINAFEKVYLDELLEQHRGNVTAAAQHAGMLRSALQRLLRKYRLKSADFRRAKRVSRPVAGKPADEPR
jgi:DNA-binding NtrC family response regulator